jgi:hypothetical protein
MDKMATCDNIKARVGEVMLGAHCYKNNMFLIHEFNMMMTFITMINFRWFVFLNG